MINIYNMEDITEYHWLKNRPDYERIISINAKKKRRKKAKKNNKQLKTYLSYDNQLSHPLWLKKREYILNKKRSEMQQMRFFSKITSSSS